jgi:hypothetical protein
MAAIGASVGAVAGSARAELPACPTDTGNAREMERQGRALFDEALRREAADPRGALEILSCVQRIADKPAVSLRVGIIAERLGNPKLAVGAYERYLALAGDAAPDRVELGRHIESLRRSMAAQQKPEPPPAPPRQERVPAPSEPERSSPTLGYVTLATGGLLLAGGGLFLLSAKNRSDDVHAIEPGTTYWNSPEAKGELDAAKREQTFGYIGLAAGALAAGVGAWLVLDHESGVSTSVAIGPSSTAAKLRFRF